jgi:hypothetical protein
VIPESLVDYLAGIYVGLREGDADTGNYTTARTLLGVIRLSQALVKKQTIFYCRLSLDLATLLDKKMLMRVFG